MSHDALADRRHALEEAFFARQTKELVEQMRKKAETAEERERLAAATGITDAAALDRFLALGLHPTTISALSLVPLVLVAWADGRLEGKERREILAAASANGVVEGTESYDSLMAWLHELPAPGLFEAWRDYVQALCRDLGAEGTAQLKEDILSRAIGVAKAAGGWWDLGAVSNEERGVIARLEQAFD